MIDASPMVRRMGAVLVTVCVLGTLCISNQAYAAKKTKLLVVQVQSDDLEAEDKAAATTVIRDAISKRKAIDLLETPKTDFLELMMEVECTDVDAQCVGSIGKKYGASRVLYAEASKADGKLTVKLMLVRVAGRKVLKKEEATVAGKSDMPGLLVKQIAAIFGPVLVAKPAATRVRVAMAANEKGARIYLNGKLAGKTPMARKLRSGLYRVKVVKKGFITIERKLRVGAEKLSMNFTLEKKPATKLVPVVPIVKAPVVPQPAPDTAKQDRPFYAQWWFWTAVGVGVAGIATTAVLLSVDSDPVEHGVINFGVAAPDYDPLVLEAQ